MLTLSDYDFGYPWWMTWGHLIPLFVFGLLALAAWRFHWRRWITVIAGLVSLWGLAGFLIVNRVLVPNQPLPMPTARFLPDGSGRVLDLGAGSGRATLMVLQNRPRATVVAVDIYQGYWGIADNTPARLQHNAAAGGVADRVEVRTADMRELPFPDASFDAAVSSFAIDHLRREGIDRALREAARVLKPGGQILIINLRPDVWIRLALLALPGHGYFGIEQESARWRRHLTGAGFEMVEEGTQPGAKYFLAQRPRAAASMPAPAIRGGA